jgi:hypothetical protein
VTDHDFKTSMTCSRCGVTVQALAEARRQPRILWSKYGVEMYVGPWVSRLDWSPGRFGWIEGQNAFIRFIRRWWSGWHRWDGCDW